MGLMEYRVISVLWLHETEQREAPGIYRATKQEAVINDLARDGWELVTATYLPSTDRAGFGRVMMFFKRLRREDPAST
jgi:hypothetical protein